MGSTRYHAKITPPGRGCWSIEACTWRTSPTERKERIGLKAFLRVKLGLGGRAPASARNHPESPADGHGRG
jgi:hypothetical protein